MNSEKFLIGTATTIIVLLLILIGLQFFPRPFPPMMPNPNDMEKGFLKMLDEIKATDDQKEELKKAQSTHRLEMDKISDEIRLKREDLKNEFNKETLDTIAIEKKHNALKQALEKREDLHLKMILSLSDILTPAQRIKMQQKMEEKHHPRGERRPMPPHMMPQ